MRGHYVQQASLLMDADADAGAPGAAVTLELCGSWEHRPPSPLAPHHTSPQRKGGAELSSAELVHAQRIAET